MCVDLSPATPTLWSVPACVCMRFVCSSFQVVNTIFDCLAVYLDDRLPGPSWLFKSLAMCPHESAYCCRPSKWVGGGGEAVGQKHRALIQICFNSPARRVHGGRVN